VARYFLYIYNPIVEELNSSLDDSVSNNKPKTMPLGKQSNLFNVRKKSEGFLIVIDIKLLAIHVAVSLSSHHIASLVHKGPAKHLNIAGH
jgi:hypothetical protein